MNKAKIASKPKRRRNVSNEKQRNGLNGARRNGETERETRALRVAPGAREELRSAIQRYTDLYEFAPVGYITFDRSGRIEQMNLAACELLEAKRDRVIGAPFSLFVAHDYLNFFFLHLVRCRAGEGRMDTALHLKKRSGETVSVLLCSTRQSDFTRDGNHCFLTAIVDLTERERADQVIRDKEAELEQIVTQTPFMLTRCTRDLRYRYASRAYAEMTGLPSEDLAGKPIVEIMGERGLKAVRPYIDRVLKGETVTYEMEVPFAKGKIHFLRATYVPDKNANGEVIGWIDSLIDMTERRRAEQAVQRLAAVVQSSHDAIATKDLNGIITDWNQSAQRIFGYKRNEIIGKSILTLIPKDRQNEEQEILAKIRRGESIDHYETIRRRKDGGLIDVALTISPIKDRNGNIVGVSKIARDISKQKQVERRLAEQARLLNLSNEAILVRDRDDRIIYWNDGAAELYGYSAKEALGKVTHELLQTEHPELFEAIYKQLEREGHWSGEMVHRRKGGHKLIVMSHWALDRDESGKRAYVLETNSDITARKRAELALQTSKKMLEQLVQRRTKALRVANTELQSEIVQRKGLEDEILEISDREQQRLGQELHDGLCQQLTAIGFLARATALRLKDHRVGQNEDLEKIAQLINSSVIDARNLARDLHKEEVDAAEFESALRQLVERKIWTTPCRLDLQTKINIGDDKTASELYRTLREAIVNANKHARATEIVLQIRRSKNELVFSVNDDGVGFKKKRQRGHGLGLRIMKYRVESIGGHLELQPREKGGTRVTVYLPLTE